MPSVGKLIKQQLIKFNRDTNVIQVTSEAFLHAWNSGSARQDQK